MCEHIKTFCHVLLLSSSFFWIWIMFEIILFSQIKKHKCALAFTRYSGERCPDRLVCVFIILECLGWFCHPICGVCLSVFSCLDLMSPSCWPWSLSPVCCCSPVLLSLKSSPFLSVCPRRSRPAALPDRAAHLQGLNGRLATLRRAGGSAHQAGDLGECCF